MLLGVFLAVMVVVQSGQCDPYLMVQRKVHSGVGCRRRRRRRLLFYRRRRRLLFYRCIAHGRGVAKTIDGDFSPHAQQVPEQRGVVFGGGEMKGTGTKEQEEAMWSGSKQKNEKNEKNERNNHPCVHCTCGRRSHRHSRLPLG